MRHLGGTSMSRFTAALLAVAASVSSSSWAEKPPRPPPIDPNPTGQPRTIVRVETWGSITDVAAGTRSVGDRVHYVMRIDTGLSPPDREDDADRADYVWNTECERNCPPDIDALSFVATAGAPVNLAGPSFDRVLLRDHVADPRNPGGTLDIFDVSDQEFAQWDGLGGYFTAEVGVRSAVDFIAGDWLAQSFELDGAKDPSLEANAGVSSFLGGVFDAFNYALDRIRVSSHVCRM
jgi:hypothetical protein